MQSGMRLAIFYFSYSRVLELFIIIVIIIITAERRSSFHTLEQDTFSSLID